VWPSSSDEGADILAEWTRRTEDLNSTSTVRDILRDSFADEADLHDFLSGPEAAARTASGPSGQDFPDGDLIPEARGDVDVATMCWVRGSRCFG